MTPQDYVMNKMRAMREHNMLGLSVKTERASPNKYTVERLGGRQVSGFLSCSYMGLEWDARLAEAAIAAVRDYGTQFSSSRAIASTDHYAQIEDRLERIMGVRPVIASTTTLAHLAALPLLAGEEDAIILDAQVHNSVHMAARQCKLTGTSTVQIPHSDLKALEARIAEARAEGKRRIWYMADGLYSMYGDFADMRALFDLMARYDNFHCYVDDAHSVGWLGPRGAGHAAPWLERPHGERLVVAASMAKTFAACGGVILTRNAHWRDLISMCGETMIFSGPLQPPVSASVMAACDIMLSNEMPELQVQLRGRIEAFQTLIELYGIESLSSGQAPIFLLDFGSMERLKALSAHLLAAGYYAPPVTYPAVPLNRFCIRVVVNRLHTDDQLCGLAEAIAAFEQAHPRPAARGAVKQQNVSLAA